jgi:tetratricopeptide (TPR) repeat protein
MVNLNAHHRRLAQRRMILLLGLAMLPGAPDAAASDGEVTVMEPVFVEASSGDPWIYFTVPGFEVISHCPDSFNESYARALERATAARLAVLPSGFWGDMPTPMKIVLYNREPERRSGFNRGNPIDLAWVSGDGASVGTGTVMRSYPVTVGDGDTYINCGNYWSVQIDSGSFSVDPDSDVRLQNRVPRLPAWFEAGMEGQFGLYPSQIIRSSAFSDEVVLASATWVSTVETLAIMNEAKEKEKEGKVRHPREMLPLGELFRGRVPAGKTALWNSEASLFVRWGLYAGGNRQAFLDFADAASREPVTEELFRRHFGYGYAEAQARLDAYLPKAVSEPISVPIAVPPEKPLRVREATSVEVARIIGDWGRLEGRSIGIANMDYQRECLDQADRLFERIYRRRSSNPLFLAAFGLYEVQVGDTVRARDALESATAAGVARPRAYVELARLRLDEALPSAQQGIGDLDRPEFTAIVSLLTTARVQMPSLLATYDVLARTLEHAPSRPTREDLRPLEEALELFPQNAPLAYKVANLLRDDGYADEAASVVERATRFSDSDQSRALLADFLAKKAR